MKDKANYKFFKSKSISEFIPLSVLIKYLINDKNASI